MPDQPAANAPAGDAQSHPLPPTPFEVALDQRVMTLEAENSAKARDLKSNNILSNVGRGECWLIGINGLLLIVTVIIACIYNEQLTQMRIATTEATKATKATQDAVYEACRNSQISRAALLQSIQAGRDSHDASIASTYMTIVSAKSEAAYVAPYVKSLLLVPPGQPILVHLGLKNKGKTAAKNIVFDARTVFVKTTENPPLVYPIGSFHAHDPRLEAEAEPSSMWNGVFVAVRDGKVAHISSPIDADDYTMGRKDVLVFARVTYDDSLGVHHWVHFCHTFPSMDNRERGRQHEQCIHYNKEDGNSALEPMPSLPSAPALVPEIVCRAPED